MISLEYLFNKKKFFFKKKKKSFFFKYIYINKLQTTSEKNFEIL